MSDGHDAIEIDAREMARLIEVLNQLADIAPSQGLAALAMMAWSARFLLDLDCDGCRDAFCKAADDVAAMLEPKELPADVFSGRAVH